MSQSKIWAVHLEADGISELKHKLIAALSQLEAVSLAAGGKDTPAAKAPAKPKETPAADPAPAPSTATLENVKNKLTELKTLVDAPDKGKAKKGLAAVKAVLAEFNVTNSTDLKAPQYDAVIAAIEAAIAKAKGGGEESAGGDEDY